MKLSSGRHANFLRGKCGATTGPCTCAPSSWSRSRSTMSSRARSTRAAWRCASRASRVTARTSGPTKPIPSTRCGASSSHRRDENAGRVAGVRRAPASPGHCSRARARRWRMGAEADDAALCEGFEAVEAARNSVPLTYFEFGTLAAFWLFQKERIETAILEVGLGGRLDAVNIMDADCAVLTSVGIDHVDYLGPDRESIGREKAGIFRAGRPAVVAEPAPPQSVLQSKGEKLLIGRDFGYRDEKTQWTYWGPRGKRAGLAHPALRGSVQRS